ncbi:MAG: hypothetical protein K8S99_07110 [Planctomycetes bacterium]|nr:hypothetical protein [Planctomycetota bacterium]
MERERFVRMRLSLSHAATGHHNPRAAYSDKVILLVLLWAALHRKPISRPPRHAMPKASATITCPCTPAVSTA